MPGEGPFWCMDAGARGMLLTSGPASGISDLMRGKAAGSGAGAGAAGPVLAVAVAAAAAGTSGGTDAMLGNADAGKLTRRRISYSVPESGDLCRSVCVSAFLHVMGAGCANP